MTLDNKGNDTNRHHEWNRTRSWIYRSQRICPEKRTNERMDEWKNEWTSERASERRDEWINDWMKTCHMVERREIFHVTRPILAGLNISCCPPTRTKFSLFTKAIYYWILITQRLWPPNTTTTTTTTKAKDDYEAGEFDDDVVITTGKQTTSICTV